MRFTPALIPGVLVSRYKRFLADVRLDSGELVTAHCANPGSMRTCLEVGGRVWLSRSANPRRRLPFTWEIAELGAVRVFVNPLCANRVVEEGLQSGVVEELRGFSNLTREVRTGGKNRIDFALDTQRGRCFVEVKNVTLTLGGGRAAFPDSVTERGARHLDELMRLHRQGHRAVLLFCVSRSDATSAEAATAIDPNYARALHRAARQGVEILAYKCSVTRQGVSLARRLPVLLG
jgi:sugar fermentation stimulation protein A